MLKKIIFFALFVSLNFSLCNAASNPEDTAKDTAYEIENAIKHLSDENLALLHENLSENKLQPEEFVPLLQEMLPNNKIFITAAVLISVGGALVIVGGGATGIAAIATITAAELARRN